MTIIGGNFKTTENADGTITIHDVPIFSTCKRGEYVYDEAWMDAALQFAKQAEADGHLPPVHVYHHGDTAKPIAAGVFRMKRIHRRMFKGSIKPMHIVDLILTNREVFDAIKGHRLLYRSIEADYAGRSIRSLALLDSEAPFFDLPMTTVQPLTKGDETPVGACANADPVLAFRGASTTRVLMEFNDMADKQTFTAPDGTVYEITMSPVDGGKPAEFVFTAPASNTGTTTNFEDDKPEDEEKMADDAPEGEGEAKATLGDIDLSKVEATAEEWAAFLAEVQGLVAKLQGGDDATEEAGEVEEHEGPAEIMQAGKADKFAALMTEQRALKAKVEQMERVTATKAALDKAEADLGDRITGKGLRAELEAFAADFGVPAMKGYVAKLKSTLPPVGVDLFGRPVNAAALPAEVQKFRSNPDHYEIARRVAKDYDPAATRVPLARAIQNEIDGAGLFARVNQEA